MKSKSRKRNETIDCVSCQVKTDLFVAILKNNSGNTMEKHWFVCLNCYEEDRCQIKAPLKAKRVPLRGRLGGEYSGDIHIELEGRKLVGEVKYRDTSNFPSPFTVLEGRDIAFYKRRRGTPQTLVIMTGEQFQKIMEDSYGNSNETDQSSS